MIQIHTATLKCRQVLKTGILTLNYKFFSIVPKTTHFGNVRCTFGIIKEVVIHFLSFYALCLLDSSSDMGNLSILHEDHCKTEGQLTISFQILAW